MAFPAGVMNEVQSDKTGEVVARIDLDTPMFQGRVWGKAPDVAEVTDKTPEYALYQRAPRSGNLWPAGAAWRKTPLDPAKSKASHYYTIKVWVPPMDKAIWLVAFPAKDDSGAEVAGSYNVQVPVPGRRKPAPAGSLDDASEPVV